MAFKMNTIAFHDDIFKGFSIKKMSQDIALLY